MNHATLATWLADSFKDYRLDNSEKTQLRDIAASLSLDSRRYTRNHAFELVRDAITAGTANAVDALRWLEQTVKALDAVEAETGVSAAYFSPGDACRNAILDQLHRARKSVDICVFTLSDDRIASAVLRVHERGVPVRLITDNDKANDEGSDMDYLQRKGLSVRFDTTPYHMHHKFALFDRNTLLNGSFNWTRNASESNEENVVVSNEPALVEAFLQQFERLWDQFA